MDLHFARLALACATLALTGCTRGDGGAATDDTGKQSAGADTGTQSSADKDGDGFPESEDCDDTNFDVHPGAIEICNGVDDDCDGNIDDDAVDAVAFYVDADGDGYGDPTLWVDACWAPTGHVGNDSDCDDTNPAIHPDASETDCTDPVDYNCDGSVGYADADDDGVPACEDCDDTDPGRSPSLDEVCDEDDIDEDCSGHADDDDDRVDETTLNTYYRDADGDGYGTDSVDPVQLCDQPTGYVVGAGDCDDLDAARNPGEVEVCDGANTDEDCDELADDSDPSTDPSSWVDYYEDADGDTYGDPDSSVLQCDVPTGYVEDGTDCDDGSAGINPGEVEVCDDANTDEDCSGAADDSDPSTDSSTWVEYYLDADDDGYGDAESSVLQCDMPTGYVEDGTDCDDASADVNPGATEVCDVDAVDEDCTGAADDDDDGVDVDTLDTFYLDSDGDGYGTDGVDPILRCRAPEGYVADSSDCDDGDAGRSPGLVETCDDADTDEDCDGLADDSDPSTDSSTWIRYHADTDGDGYGDADSFVLQCDAPEGYVEDDTDCDDDSADVNPGGSEVCDSGDVDEDCDGTSDDDDDSAVGATTWYADEDGDDFGASDSALDACNSPAGYVSVDGDCDDGDEETYPGATDKPYDGIDQDCSGSDASSPENGVGYTFWPDADHYDSKTSPLPIVEVADRFGVTGIYIWASDAEYFVEKVLDDVAATGLTFYLNLGGKHSNFTDASGNFDYDMWVDHMENGDDSNGWESSDGAGGVWKDHLQEYVDSGQARCMLLDDVTNFSGDDPTGAELDAMGAYMKDLFPGIYVMVRKQPSELPIPPGGVYRYIDGAGSMYYASDGDIDDWIDTEVAAYARTGLGTIWGIAISSGGDGSSGEEGWGSGYWAMSADEIIEVGDKFIEAPGTHEIYTWDYSYTDWYSNETFENSVEYFDQTELTEALQYVADRCALADTPTDLFNTGEGFVPATPTASTPTVEDFTYAVSTSKGTDLDVALDIPDSEPGDRMFIVVMSDNSTDWQHVGFNELPGWKHLVYTGQGSGDKNAAQPEVKLSVYTRVYDGTEDDSVTIGGTGGSYWWAAWCLRVVGGDTQIGIEQVGTPLMVTSSSDATIPGVTTTEDDSLVLALWAYDGADAGTVTLSGTGWETSPPADQLQVANSGSTGLTGFWVAKTVETAGDSGDLDVTTSLSDGMAGVQIVIPPQLPDTYIPILMPSKNGEDPRDWESQSLAHIDERLEDEGGPVIEAVDDTDENDTSYYIDFPTDIDSVTRLWARMLIKPNGDITVGEDEYGCSLRIMNGSTVLAAANDTGDFQPFCTDVGEGKMLVSLQEWAYVNSAASAEDWTEGAQIEIRQDYTYVVGNGSHMGIAAIEVEGFYTRSE